MLKSYPAPLYISTNNTSTDSYISIVSTDDCHVDGATQEV